jgi:hypothetical protein
VIVQRLFDLFAQDVAVSSVPGVVLDHMQVEPGRIPVALVFIEAGDEPLEPKPLGRGCMLDQSYRSTSPPLRA